MMPPMSWIKLIFSTMIWMYLLLPLVTCSLSLPHEGKDYAAPRYNISLDLKPEKRWNHVLQDYNVTDLKGYVEGLLHFIKPSQSKELLFALADVYITWFAQEPYAGEMRGMAKAVDIPLSEIVVLNLMYEYIACTSIIIEDAKGSIYHGRNMDFIFPNMLKKITIDVDFIKNGQVEYTGTTFVGFVGLWTGQKPYQFTISANARENNISMLKNIFSLLYKASPVSWLIRNTLNEAPDYQSAVLQLSNTPIITEIYLTVAGVNPGEGASIARNRNGVANVMHLNASYGEWFLLQTNDDTWLNPPPDDVRWYLGTQALNATGQENINKDSLYKVLSTPKVLNRMTIHTTMMSAASPQDYVSFIRD
ncbi:N-acylethanolamine-hydrolyzing acid amidase-like [Engystomops pustulosus]